MIVSKKFKGIISAMLVVLIMASLVGCGKQEPAPGGGTATGGGGAATPSEGFSWDMASGSKIQVMFNQHTYADGIIQKIPEFEALTGIKVEYALTPEENYFDKLTTALNSRSGNPDIFMTGAYQLWQYAPAGYVADLTPFIEDPNMTNPDYNMDDFFPKIVDALKWDLVPGNKVGTGPQWALPIGFETNNLAYNKKVFEERGLEPPKTMEDLLKLTKELNEFDGPGTYALAIRGARNWGTIHAGYMTTYSNYGAVDFAVEDGKLVSKVNSPEAIEMTEMWVDLIKAGGSPSWSSYTWYQAGADFGAGKAAMLFDASCNGYFQNPDGASQEAGNLAWVSPPLPEGMTQINSNLWTWSLGMNEYSKNKTAAWLFMQYFTGPEYQLWAAINASAVDPARQSVFNDPEFQAVFAKSKGYAQAMEETVDGTTIQFTPQPHFFETTTEWAATLQDIVGGKYASVEEGMNALKVKMDQIVSDVVIE
ncbi:ABC transporter substrate-binding protein [Anaerotalea alkaliphila]|uniref:Sugar ABC transporter substrate-binding protein n=1 Tax=Anaerotalea alkaliphila TaxID=2662126 RepID=A0A7X5HW17_9FIRM|nr:sugar ABC transporter substrate-binding protein [Anaerotalea alkaliphila]NDL67690.1 sugar ABC transporter substrate-binding protein [Anaerotalea alkaliphila]